MKLVTDFLEWQAKYNPNKIAIVSKGEKYTYAYLETQANCVGHWLCHVGVKQGDRVVLYGANGVQLVIALFGSLKAGATFVPVHPNTPFAKLKFILQDCTPSAIVIDPELIDKHKSLANQYPCLIASSNHYTTDLKEEKITSWDELDESPEQLTHVKVTPNKLAAIIYTSGSTKEPRGVMLPHRQMVFATSAINTVIGNHAEDVILCGLPLSFDYGLYQIFLTFQVGAKIILELDFSVPLAIPRILKLNKVTGFPGVPSIFAMLLRSGLLERVELPHLRYITSTGDILPVPHIRQLRELFPHTTIFPMYGLTECKRVSIMPQGHTSGHESSVGQPLPGTQAFVVDETGEKVAPGIVGELVVRGPHVMEGYWNAPEETAHRFRRDVSTGEVFLYTGDFFQIDEEGFLYFVGRNETFIKSRGQKVSAAEVESFLCAIKGVAEAAVVGVPDAMLGESVCAFVSLVKANEVTSTDIIEQCKQGLLQTACPKHIIMLDPPLPKNQNGKINRTELRLMAIKNINSEG